MKMKQMLAVLVIMFTAVSFGWTQDQADKKFLGTWELVL